MKIAHYGVNQTEQGKLFSAVLEDLQGRHFTLLGELQLCHFVIRGRTTIRTIAYKEHGLHFAIRALNKDEKDEFVRQHLDADFMLVGMKVTGSQYYADKLLHETTMMPLCTWPRTLYFAYEDVVQLPATARDAVLISRAIMERLMRAEGTISDREIHAEIAQAYTELAVKARTQSDWD